MASIILIKGTVSAETCHSVFRIHFLLRGLLCCFLLIGRPEIFYTDYAAGFRIHTGKTFIFSHAVSGTLHLNVFLDHVDHFTLCRPFNLRVLAAYTAGNFLVYVRSVRCQRLFLRFKKSLSFAAPLSLPFLNRAKNDPNVLVFAVFLQNSILIIHGLTLSFI